jgi:hypothetical protein
MKPEPEGKNQKDNTKNPLHEEEEKKTGAKGIPLFCP